MVGVLFGLGGLVHVGSILGFGGAKWSEMPIQFKIGDIVWGALDFVAVVGVVLRSPLGVLAILVAALSQIVMYRFFPDLFVLKQEHRTTLRGMVWFHVAVIVLLGGLAYIAGAKKGS